MKGKIVFITGASSGIGEGCARKFASQGSDLILNARNVAKLEELKKVLRCYQMVPFWEKREADKWASLKVVIDGVESEAAWSIMAKDVPEFMKEDSQRALSFEVFEKE